jgi:hypothetical protein
MYTVPIANPEGLAFHQRGVVTAVLASTAFFVLDLKRRRLRWLRRIILILAGLLIANVGLFLFAHVSAWHTQHDIIKTESGVFIHPSDPLSTDIFAYITGRGPRPEYIRAKREYVRDMLKKADIPVPEDFDFYTDRQIDETVRELYRARSLDSKESFDAVFYDLIADIETEAREPAIKNITDEEYASLGALWQRGGGFRIRYSTDKRNGSQLRNIMTASSRNGDLQNFHGAPENTLYIRYSDSVQSLLDESGHLVRYQEEPYLYYADMIIGGTRSLLRAIVRIPQTASELHRDEYRDPTTFEGRAHLVDGPAVLEELHLNHLETKVNRKPDEEHICVMPEVK